MDSRFLNSIGRAIPEHAQWPPHVKVIKDGLGSIDVAYHLNHRIDEEVLFDTQTGSMKEGIGHYHFRDKGDNAALMVCDNPYPCAFDLGIVQAVAEKFQQPGEHPNVEHGPGACRKAGSTACTYLVSW